VTDESARRQPDVIDEQPVELTPKRRARKVVSRAAAALR
jgi:hypothetical protein